MAYMPVVILQTAELRTILETFNRIPFYTAENLTLVVRIFKGPYCTEGKSSWMLCGCTKLLSVTQIQVPTRNKGMKRHI